MSIKGYGACELATINSQEEQEAATATISAKYMTTAWIGLTRLEDEDHWYWSDGSPVNYENWRSPSNQLDINTAGYGELNNDWKCVANGFGNYDHSYGRWNYYWGNMDCS